MMGTHSANKNPTRVRGSYVLEMAFVFLGVGTVAVAVHDVASVFRARNTARAAVQEGLRCLYATDARCVSPKDSGTKVFETRYDVTTKQAGFFIPREKYSANASWWEEPRLELAKKKDSLSATFVTSPPSAAAQQELLVPVDHHSLFLLQRSDLPQITGKNTRQPDFKKKVEELVEVGGKWVLRTSFKDQGPTARVDISDLKLMIPADAKDQKKFKDSDSVEFTVQAIKDSGGSAVDLPSQAALVRQKSKGVRSEIECRLSTSGDTPGQVPQNPCVIGGLNTKDLSETFGSKELLKVPVFLWITGSSYSSDPQAWGKVAISYRINGGGLNDLGGQSFGGRNDSANKVDEKFEKDPNSGGYHNFIIRGAGYGDMSEEAADAYGADQPKGGGENEIKKYGKWIWVPDGAKVEVYFSLERSPAYTADGKEVVGGAMTGVPIGWKGHQIQVFYPQFEFNHLTHGCGYVNNPAICANPPRDGRPESYREMGAQPITVQPTGSVVCRGEGAVEPLYPPGSSGAAIAGVGEATAWPVRYWEETETDECKARVDNYPTCNNVDIGERFVGCQREQPVLSDGEVFDYCNVPASLRKAGAILSRNVSSADSPQSYRSCTDKGGVPECALSEASSKGWEVWSPPPPPAPACDEAQKRYTPELIHGPVDANTCSSISAGVKELYLDRYGSLIPAGVPVVVTGLEVSPAERRSPTRPASCTPYTEKIDESECGTRLTKAQADKCCEEAQGKCKLTEKAYELSARDRSYGVGIEGARQRARELIEVAYPNLRMEGYEAEGGCNGVEGACLVSLRGSFTRDNTRAVMSAEMKIPLIMKSLAQLGPHVVEYQEERVLERALVE